MHQRSRQSESIDLRKLARHLDGELTNWDESKAARFKDHVLGEIRSEIARQAAAVIHGVRHGIWDSVQFRAAIKAWQLIKEVEKKCASNFWKAPTNNLFVVHGTAHRLFTTNGKPSLNGILPDTHFAFDNWDSLLEKGFSALSPDHFSQLRNEIAHPGGMRGSDAYDIIFFRQHLSIRDEWRVVADILDHFTTVASELTDGQLLQELVSVVVQQFISRGRVRIGFLYRIWKFTSVLTLYDLVRRYAFITSLCPPLQTASSFLLRNDGPRRHTNDINKRPTHRGAVARRAGTGRAPWGFACNQRCGRRTQRRRDFGGHAFCWIANDPRDRQSSTPVLRRRRQCLLDLLRVASA